MAAGGEFEWRPGAPRRMRGALLAVPVLAACAAAGAGLSWFLPIEKLIVAIERNGVPLPPAEATSTGSTPGEPPPISAATPSVSPQPEPPREVVVINSGTARPADFGEPVSVPAGAEMEQRPANAIDGQSAPKTVLPPSAGHRNSSDRRVLVVVRRTAPPYDTKVLRGRISNGRLIVDSRDRRGLIIR